MLTFYTKNTHIAEIEYPQGTCSPRFVVEDLSDLFYIHLLF